MPIVRERRGAVAAVGASLRLAIALALWLPIRPAAAEDLVWLPLTALDGEARTMIEAAAHDGSIGALFDFGTPGDLQVAFAEIREHAGEAPPPDRSDLILRLAPEACRKDHCPVMIMAWDQGAYVMLTLQRGPEFALGTGFSHGLRNLLVRGDHLWFTGRDYIDTGSVEGWRVLTDVDPADRAWIETALDIGTARAPAPALPVADRAFVAFVDLDDAPSSAQARPEVIVLDKNYQSCVRRGCAVTIYATDGDRPAVIGEMLGYAVDLGPDSHHGKRDLLIDGTDLFTFDGERYRGGD
jgi:hypothetical protein